MIVLYILVWVIVGIACVGMLTISIFSIIFAIMDGKMYKEMYKEELEEMKKPHPIQKANNHTTNRN